MPDEEKVKDKILEHLRANYSNRDVGVEHLVHCLYLHSLLTIVHSFHDFLFYLITDAPHSSRAEDAEEGK